MANIKQFWILLFVFISCSEKELLQEDSNKINVTKFGAAGNDNEDDTGAIQKAINEASKTGGGVVYIPEGTYLIDAKQSLVIRSNVTLQLAANAILEAKANTNERYDILYIKNVENVKVVGGTIKGDRNIHIGNRGEWGMGIGIYDGKNIVIENVLVRDCWGDGIYIGKNRNRSENIILEKVKCVNNRRQGVSITAAHKVTINHCVFSQTNGIPPQAGVDIEPNATDTVSNVVIKNSIFDSNENSGILIYTGAERSFVSDVFVEKCFFVDNRNWAGYIIEKGELSSVKNIHFLDNRLKNNIQKVTKLSANEFVIKGKCVECVMKNNIVIK